MERIIDDMNLLRTIFSHLIQRDAIRARRVCRALLEACDSLSPSNFKPRLMLACSESAKVLELHPFSNDMVIATGQWLQKKLSSQNHYKGKRPNWITGICINPQDRDLYALQYRCPGVIRFSGYSMRYKHITFKSNDLEHPEGLAFAFGSMFVQNNWGEIFRLTPEEGAATRPLSSKKDEWHIQESFSLARGAPDHEEEVRHIVTWGLCHYGDSLYSACDEQYDSKMYTEPPPGAPTGRVIRLKLGEAGTMMASSDFTKVPIKRPSGLRFDAAGRLWVTSMSPESGLMCFAGPSGAGSSSAGTLLLSIALGPGLDGLFPWDVVTLTGSADRTMLEVNLSPAKPDDVIVVTSMHASRSLRTSRAERDCRLVMAKVVCSYSNNNEPMMQLLWQWSRSLPNFCSHANMMCVDEL